ncbi:MAG TPA: hypothetical protein PKD55_24710, partial [Bellilinea sp.]|nr:hypothetical protein [Bellilinea sp.]
QGLHRSIVNNPDLSASDIVEWCDYARRSFYLRPKFVFEKIIEVIRHPREIGRMVKAFAIFFPYLFRSSSQRKSD